MIATIECYCSVLLILLLLHYYYYYYYYYDHHHYYPSVSSNCPDFPCLRQAKQSLISGLVDGIFYRAGAPHLSLKYLCQSSRIIHQSDIICDLSSVCNLLWMLTVMFPMLSFTLYECASEALDSHNDDVGMPLVDHGSCTAVQALTLTL